jgi:hypothetical protein
MFAALLFITAFYNTAWHSFAVLRKQVAGSVTFWRPVAYPSGLRLLNEPVPYVPGAEAGSIRHEPVPVQAGYRT